MDRRIARGVTLPRFAHRSISSMPRYLAADEAVTAMATQPIRGAALRYSKDRRFVALWDRFLAREFGPIRRVA
jgi:hypothetical protein